MKRIRCLIGFCIVLIWYAGKMIVSGRRMQEAGRLRHIASLERRGGQRLCRTLGVTVSTKGDVQVEKPVLVVSNQVGLLDSWVLASQFSVAFAAKIEMANWPVFA